MPVAEETKLYAIKDVEIFSAGSWNDTKITHEDLSDMVRSFEDLKVGWRPCLKLGHDNQQLVAKASGLPAIGWVDRMYVRADKLYADFSDIPERVYNLIKSKAYRKVSCEIYFDLTVNKTEYKAVLGAVALLGADKPGVMNLNDILGQFAKWEQAEVFAIMEKEGTFKQYQVNFELNQEDGTMPTVEQLQAELALANKKQADFEAKQADEAKARKEADEAKDAEIAKLKEFQATAIANAAKLELEKREADLKAFTTKLEAAKLLTPATKSLLEQVLGDKKEFSIEEGKKCSREEVFEKILKLTVDAAKVNFDESSLAEFDKKDDKEKNADKKIEQYMKDNKCDYATAYKATQKSA